ncbi:16S rRNA (cytidine(1402)-2'-O)-methyltransferase [Paenibacillus sp. y28]|uniref:16S rRNA (cytidine(1402)-2'-O)-methyltransferase n=1 Tax=Paenibacillus sp. y28 TaxID=3129110 RepID=UPI00301625D2
MRLQKSFQGAKASGTLYLVATPIGNLEDMTYRAVRTLKEVQWIAAEDTRQTRKLLAHFEIGTRLVAYHEHNKRASGPELIRLLLQGESIALVSDAGLPAISDPGSDLVRLAVEAEVPIVPVPGANAALSALIVSGLPTDTFRFHGFLPREKKPLREALEKLDRAEETLIFYESPHRVAKTLQSMIEVWGDRPVALARELTKKHEELLRGTISEALAHLDQHEALGEYCIVVGRGEPGAAGAREEAWWNGLSLEDHVARYEAQTGDRKEAMKRAAQDRGVSKRDIYNELNR